MASSQFDQLTGQFLRAVRDSGGGLVAVCAACVRVLPVRAAAIVLEERDAGMQPWCASDEFADSIESAQATAGEGPAVAAVADGMPVLLADLGCDCERWPGFAEALAGLPVSGSMLAVPLRLGAIRLGAVDFYRDAVGPPGPRLLSAALHIADLVTASLILAGSGEAHRWSQPLSSRWIHQAAGMTSAQLSIGREDACARLRAYAFTLSLPLAEVARRVVDGSLRLPRE